MTSNEFFNLPVGLTFTVDELFEIKDALFTAETILKEKKLYRCAKSKSKIYEKIHNYTKYIQLE